MRKEWIEEVFVRACVEAPLPISDDGLRFLANLGIVIEHCAHDHGRSLALTLRDGKATLDLSDGGHYYGREIQLDDVPRAFLELTQALGYWFDHNRSQVKGHEELEMEDRDD